MTSAESGSIFENQEKAPAPPPPPPPPARPFERAHTALSALPAREAVRGGDVPRDAAEAIARVSILADRLMGIERELVELQVFRRKVELGGASDGRAHAPERSTSNEVEVALLKSENEKLRQQVSQGGDPGEKQKVQRDLDAAREDATRAREEVARANDELDRLRSAGEASAPLKAENERLVKEVERIEGELQSLKLLRDEQAKKMHQAAQQALAGFEGVALDPKVESRIKAVVIERDRLAEERTKLDTDLNRIKAEATKKIKELKTDLDKKAGESETMRLQKDNLMRQLMARDAGDAPARELTLEEITNSQVFKDMLGNIRRTSRMEVTHLHDAIAQLKDIDPKAYNLALDIIAKQFRKAAMENPLAMLPRA
jgi:hypothetical protein